MDKFLTFIPNKIQTWLWMCYLWICQTILSVLDLIHN